MEDLNNNNIIMWLICQQISMASYSNAQQKNNTDILPKTLVPLPAM